MGWLKLFNLFLLLGTAGCVTALPLDRVVGALQCEPVNRVKDSVIDGEEVGFSDSDQNLVAMLKVRRSNHDSICTATLISDRVLLTAAHCVSNIKHGDIYPQFVTSEGCPVQHRRKWIGKVDRIVLHKQFDGSPQSLSDIALLYLNANAPQDQMRVPLLEMQNPTSDRLLLIGFGVSDEKKSDSQILRRVYKSLKEDITLKDRSVILNQSVSKGGFCRGDSGAPFLVELYGEPRILAVNSASIGLTPEKQCHTLSLAMDARFFGPWVQKNKKTLESSNYFSQLFSSDVIFSD